MYKRWAILKRDWKLDNLSAITDIACHTKTTSNNLIIAHQAAAGFYRSFKLASKKNVEKNDQILIMSSAELLFYNIMRTKTSPITSKTTLAQDFQIEL